MPSKKPFGIFFFECWWQLCFSVEQSCSKRVLASKWAKSHENKKKLSLVQTTFAEFPFQYLPLLCFQIWIYRCAFYLVGNGYSTRFSCIPTLSDHYQKIIPTPPKRYANFYTPFIMKIEVLPLPTCPTHQYLVVL